MFTNTQNMLKLPDLFYPRETRSELPPDISTIMYSDCQFIYRLTKKLRTPTNYSSIYLQGSFGAHPLLHEQPPRQPCPHPQTTVTHPQVEYCCRRVNHWWQFGVYLGRITYTFSYMNNHHASLAPTLKLQSPTHRQCTVVEGVTTGGSLGFIQEG